MKDFIPTPLPGRLTLLRQALLGGGLLLLMGVMGWKAYALQVKQTQFLLAQGKQRYTREKILPAERGAIYDRNNQLLALSAPVKTIWINPQLFKPDSEQRSALAHLLGITDQNLQRAAARKGSFVYLKRQIDPALAQEVMNLNIPGVDTENEYRRFYPPGEVVGQVLGFTNDDDHGIEGVELSFDSWLRDIPGKALVMRDNRGREVQRLAVLRPAVNGRSLQVSLDLRLQYSLYRALLQTLQQWQAENASAVLLDVQTGEILAMASPTGFNPNNRGGATPSQWRNRPALDALEPGSVVKPFTVSAALDAGVIRPDETFVTGMPYYKVGPARIRDDHSHPTLDVAGILRYSSNIGATQIGQRLSNDQLYRVLAGVGFGQLPQSGLPGETTGRLAPPNTWGPVEHATISYGYGLSISALQLAAAYAALANDGVYHQPTILHRTGQPKGVRIISANTARIVRHMLEGVVEEDGTGRNAGIPGYVIAGKTGTARRAAGGHYSSQYVASFVGMAPAGHPRFVMAVMVTAPHGSIYGGIVSAPVFSKVVGTALRLYGVSPDTSNIFTPLSAQLDALAHPGKKPAVPAAEPVAKSPVPNTATTPATLPGVPAQKTPVIAATQSALGQPQGTGGKPG